MSTDPIFDRQLIRNKRDRAAQAWDQHRFLTDRVMENLIERLEDIKRTFPLALQIGAGTSANDDRRLSAQNGIENLCQMDLSSQILSRKENDFRVQADEEFLPFADNSFDLVISGMSLHTVNDLPGTLIQIRRILKPDGLFLAAMPGGETLHELRHIMNQAEINCRGGASLHVAPFADKQQIGALLQRTGFALPVTDSETLTVTYENAFKLMYDLRGMGEANSLTDRNRTPAGKKLMMETARLYNEQFANSEGRINATFEIIFMIGWAPHESQQKSLRPGSAQNSLAEALETEEIKTGDTATP
jgi:NADH dehydrogenase [ubiquinone] 1 alpha subcomplex assembly factor 5